MALETSTYISGLSSSWPTAGETKSQGDDHLRLIKGVLQNTFPNATKPFRLPGATVIGGDTTLTAANENGFFVCSGGAFNVWLPALGVGDGGWSVQVMRANGAFTNVRPASGSIYSQCGATPLIRVEQLCQPATFTWDGGGWYCWKPGGMIGEVISFDGGVPVGWMECFGGVFDQNAYCELYNVLGTTTLRQRAGRADIEWDPGYGIIGNVIGTALGSTGGAEIHYLTDTQIPSHRHTVNFTSGDDSPDHVHSGAFSSVNIIGNAIISYTDWSYGDNPAPNTGGASVRHTHSVVGDTGYLGGSSWHSNMPPSITTRKLIRAC